MIGKGVPGSLQTVTRMSVSPSVCQSVDAAVNLVFRNLMCYQAHFPQTPQNRESDISSGAQNLGNTLRQMTGSGENDVQNYILG